MALKKKKAAKRAAEATSATPVVVVREPEPAEKVDFVINGPTLDDAADLLRSLRHKLNGTWRSRVDGFLGRL